MSQPLQSKGTATTVGVETFTSKKLKQNSTEQDDGTVSRNLTTERIEPNFTTLVDAFGDGSITLNDLLPLLGPGHFVFVAGINRRTKYLYERYLQSQSDENNGGRETYGSIVFRSLSQTKLYIEEMKVDKETTMLNSYAALPGNLELLKILHQEGYAVEKQKAKLFRRNLCGFAVLGGHIEVLRWAQENGCKLDSGSCSSAAAVAVNWKS